MTAVVFDLDGTLVDSSEGILDSLRYMLSVMDAPPRADDELRRWIGPSLQQVAAELTGRHDDASVAAAVTAYRVRYRESGVWRTELFAGIPELLAELHQRGISLAIATSKPTEFSRQIVEHHQLHRWVSVVCGADWEGILTKGDLIAQAVAELGADAESSVMVGDRRFDVTGAQQHELASVGVTYGFGDRAELEDAGADIVCDTVEQLAHALRRFFD